MADVGETIRRLMPPEQAAERPTSGSTVGDAIRHLMSRETSLPTEVKARPSGSPLVDAIRSLMPPEPKQIPSPRASLRGSRTP